MNKNYHTITSGQFTTLPVITKVKKKQTNIPIYVQKLRKSAVKAILFRFKTLILDTADKNNNSKSKAVPNKTSKICGPSRLKRVTKLAKEVWVCVTLLSNSFIQ